MTVTALLFASYADAVGRRNVPLELPDGATVRDAVAEVRRLPGGDSLPQHPLVAVNQSYAEAGHVLRRGDELALIPPVAGG